MSWEKMDPILKRIGDVTIERVVAQKPDPSGIPGKETAQVLDDEYETDFSMSGEELSDDEVTDIDGVEPGEIVSKRPESTLSLDQDVNITPVLNIPSTSSEIFPSTSKRHGNDLSDHSHKKPKLDCIEIDDHEDKPDLDDPHPIEDLTGDEYETSDTECEDDKKSKTVVNLKTDFIERLGLPFDDDLTEPKPITKIDSPTYKTSLDTTDYDYDITEKLREMGEISVQPVKKGEIPPRKKSLDEPESEVSVTKKSSSNDSEEEKMGAERKIGNLRRNIREVMDETKLDEATLAAQREEMERLRRVQEQQKIIREVQRQMALNKQNSKTQHRVISLLQGGTTSITKPGGSMASSSSAALQLSPNSRNSSSVLVKMPNGETKPVSRPPRGPSMLEMIRTQKSINLQQYGGKSLLQPQPPHMHMQQSLLQQPPRGYIPSKCQITPSVSIAPVSKKPVTPPIEPEIEPIVPKPPSPALKKDVETIDVSDSDDDCIVLSEDDEPEPEPDEDPCNSGMHTNDSYNVPDEQGRVLINVGHPENEEDIFLAPQLARVIKPHQIGGVRFLFDNVIESTSRFSNSTGFGCILAHSMGLGKTLQIVCFSDIFLRHTPAKTILCIMPINTLQNWVAEFNMWLPIDPTTSPLRVQGEVRPRNFALHVLNDSHKSLTARAKVIQEWNRNGGVLLIGYELYRLLSLKRNSRSRKKKKVNEVVDLDEDDKTKTMFDEIHAALVKPGPDLVICDEGHRIKNSHASISQALKQIRSKRRVVLTGYPLQNNLLEYWCMVDFVRPNYLGTKTEFSNMFERPIQNGQCVDSTPQDVRLMRFRAHVLHSLLEGFVQRRSHAVLQVTLPQKSEYVMLVRMTAFQRKLYDTFMNDVVRTKTVPNPLKAFAVCCKIWNHPDVLYYFLKKRDESDAVDIDLEEVAAVASTPGSNPATPGSATAKKSRAKPRTTPKKDTKKGSKIAETIKPVLETPTVIAASTSSDTPATQIPLSSTMAPSDASQPQTSQTFTLNQPNYQTSQPNQPTYPQNPTFNQQFPAPTTSTNPPSSGPNSDYYNQNYPPQNNQYNYYPNQNPPTTNYNPPGANNSNYFPQNYPNYNQNNWPNNSNNWSNTEQNQQQTFTSNQSQYASNTNAPYPINQTPYPPSDAMNKDNSASNFYGGNNTNQYSMQNNMPTNTQAQITHNVPMQSAPPPPPPTSIDPNQGPNQPPAGPLQNSAMIPPGTPTQNTMGPPPGYNPIKTEPYYESQNYSSPMIKTESNTDTQNTSNYYNQNYAPPGAIKSENQPQSDYYYNQNLPQTPNMTYPPNQMTNYQKLPNQPNYPPPQSNFSYGNSEIKQESNQTGYNPPYNSTNYYSSYNAQPSIYNSNVYPVDTTGLGAPGYQNSSVPPWQKAGDVKCETESKIDIKNEIKAELMDDKKNCNFKLDAPDLKDKQEIVEEIEDEKECEIKEILPTAKLKEDAGINYDWAIELLKGYVPGCIENSAKMEILFCIIRESMALGDRILLFSQSLFTLNLIEEFLQRYQVPGHNEKWGRNNNYYRLDGSTSALEREKLINEFNANPNIHLFMVSTRAGSLGINLVGANRVVVFDASWNPCHDTQAVCRVYRYGQKKPCYVYRLVMDNCLEKKIYDRQINKQGMSDRVVDECNPDAHLSMKDVTNLCWDDEKDSEVCDFSSTKDKYDDLVMQKVLNNHSHVLSKEPFQHESLLVDRKEKKLSQAEKRMAKRSYEMEKQAVNNATRSAAYSYHGGVNTGMMHRGMRFAQDNSMHNKPIASVRPMQAELNSQIVRDGQRRTRWIPAEVWQRQGMTAQEMTLPLDVVIPTNGAERGNIVLKAGQKVLVLKSPKGIYMQLECGKIVAIRTAMKMRNQAGNNPGNNSPGGMKVPPGAGTPKSSDETSSDGSLLKKSMNRQIASPKALPMPLKNNSAVTITPRGNPQKMVKPVSKVNAYVGRMNKFIPGRSPIVPRGSNMCYPVNPTSPQSMQLSPHNKNVLYGKARPFNMMSSATGVAPYDGVNESKASSECSSETESTHRMIDETHIIPSSDDDQQTGEDKDENISDNDVAEVNSTAHLKGNESEKYQHMEMVNYRPDHMTNYDAKPDSIGSYNYPTDSNSSLDSQTHSEIYTMKNDDALDRGRQYPLAQHHSGGPIKKDIKPGLQILEVKSLNKSEMITPLFNDPDLVMKPNQPMMNRSPISNVTHIEPKMAPRSTTPKSTLKNYRHNFSSHKVTPPPAKIATGIPSALHQLEQTTSAIGIGGDDKLSLQKSLDRITSDAPGDANISMIDTSAYGMDFGSKKTQPVMPMNDMPVEHVSPKPKAKPRRNNRAKAVPKIDTKIIPQTIELDSSDNDSPTKFDSVHPLDEVNRSQPVPPAYSTRPTEPAPTSQPQQNAYDYNYGAQPMNPGYYNYGQMEQTPPSTQQVPPTMTYNNTAPPPPQYPEMGGNIYPPQVNDNDKNTVKPIGKTNESIEMRPQNDYPSNDNIEMKGGNPPVINNPYPGQQTMMPPPPPVNNVVNYGQQGQYPSSSYSAMPYPNNTYQPYQPPPYDQNYGGAYGNFHRPEMVPYPPQEGYAMTPQPPVANVQAPPSANAPPPPPPSAAPPNFNTVRPGYPPPPPPQYPQTYPQPPAQQNYNYDYNQYGNPQFNQYMNPPMYPPPPAGPAAPNTNANQPSS